MEYGEAKRFCDSWLPAWTGGAESVERLLSHYSKDSFYLDPARPEGINRREELRIYFTKLLTNNPNWKWQAEEIIPTERGFVLKWLAHIPAGPRTLAVKGLDIVEIRDRLITRNEVYFDRGSLSRIT
jgi:SnoaL-like domain